MIFRPMRSLLSPQLKVSIGRKCQIGHSRRVHVSRRQTPDATRHTPLATRHTPHATRQMPDARRQTPDARSQMQRATHHTPHSGRQTPHATRHVACPMLLSPKPSHWKPGNLLCLPGGGPVSQVSPVYSEGQLHSKFVV